MNFARLKSVISAGAMALTVLLGAGSGAKAITWNFNNVPLSDGDVLNGYFTTNVYGFLASWTMTTSGANDTFANFTYAPGTGYYNVSGPNVLSSNVITFNNGDYSEILQITFTNVISDATNAIIGDVGGPSFEQCFAWGSCGTDFIRYIAGEVASGDPLLSATPLPSTWMMLVGGALCLGFFAFGGKQKNPAIISV